MYDILTWTDASDNPVSFLCLVTPIYRVITNDVSDYINLLVRIVHITCNHPSLQLKINQLTEQAPANSSSCYTRWKYEGVSCD